MIPITVMAATRMAMATTATGLMAADMAADMAVATAAGDIMTHITAAIDVANSSLIVSRKNFRKKGAGLMPSDARLRLKERRKEKPRDIPLLLHDRSTALPDSHPARTNAHRLNGEMDAGTCASPGAWDV